MARHDRRAGSPSDNHIQHKEYKLIPADVTKETADFSKGLTIDDMPLNSAICEPAENAKLSPGNNTVRDGQTDHSCGRVG
jgi:sulfite oxidase